MTTADLAPTRIAGDVLDPLGIRELLENRLFIGTVACDLVDRDVDEFEIAADESPFGCTLVIVDPLTGGTAPPPASQPCRSDIAVALRLRPGVQHDLTDRSAVDDLVTTALARHGLDAFDTIILDGVDPYLHPAAVADLVWSLLDRGRARSVSPTGHAVGQLRSFIEHLGPAFRPAAIGVELDDVSAGSLTAGGLDLCMEVGSVPLVALGPTLAGRVDVDRLSALLHHPSRPVVVVDHRHPRARMLAVEAARTRLDRTTIRTLITQPQAPTPSGPTPTN